MKYYYVSYSCTTVNNSNTMFGCVEISVDNDITKMEHIRKMKEWIEGDLRNKGMLCPSVCILNYQLLRSE